jgi:hypothetical protein
MVGLPLVLRLTTSLDRIHRHPTDRIDYRDIDNPVLQGFLGFVHSLPLLMHVLALFIDAAMLYIECGFSAEAKTPLWHLF